MQNLFKNFSIKLIFNNIIKFVENNFKELFLKNSLKSP